MVMIPDVLGGGGAAGSRGPLRGSSPGLTHCAPRRLPLCPRGGWHLSGAVSAVAAQRPPRPSPSLVAQG